MAERRMLWKSICLSRKVSMVSLKAALLFTWAIAHMDVDGFMEADPEYIKGAVLPRRREIPQKIIPQLIEELVNIGLWQLYEDGNGKRYIKDPRWTEFQTLTKGREANSKISRLKLKLIDNSVRTQ